MIFNNPIGWAALAASLCQAGPVAVAPALPPSHLARGNDLIARTALDKSVEVARGLESRTTASYDLSHSWNNEMLFDGAYPNGLGGMVTMAVQCNTCYTKGTIAASITDTTLVDSALRLDFTGVTAYVDLAVSVSESAVYTINLFTSNTPIGMGVSGLSVGVVFAVDLVFSLSEKIDIEAGGFQVTLADGAYVEASLMEGTVTKSLFDGITAQSLPVSVTSGTATFKADLRIRTQCGAEGTSLAGIGAGLEVGVYANIIEFVSILETTEACGLQSREYWDCNVGAYALADVQIDYKTFGAVPTISTTLLSAPTATQCWGSIASAVTSALGGGGGAKYGGSTTATFVSSASSSKETGSYGSGSGKGSGSGSGSYSGSGSGSGSGSYSGSGSGSGSYSGSGSGSGSGSYSGSGSGSGSGSYSGGSGSSGSGSGSGSYSSGSGSGSGSGQGSGSGSGSYSGGSGSSGSGSYGSGSGSGSGSGKGSGSGSYSSGGSGSGYSNNKSSAQHSASASTSGSAAASASSVNSSRPASSSAASSSPVVVSSSAAAVSSTTTAAAVSSTPASTVSPPPTSSAVLSTSPSATATSASVGGGGGGAAVTSTVFSTTTYTITSCAASVVNCPASYQTSYVVTKTYTNKGGHSKGTGSAAVITTTNGAHLSLTPTTTNIIVLVPCTSPIVQTFTPPTALPTSGKGNGGSSSGSGSGSGSGSSGSYGSSGNSTLSGTFSPTASKTGSASGVVVTAGAVSASIVSSSLVAAVGVFAAALLL